MLTGAYLQAEKIMESIELYREEKYKWKLYKLESGNKKVRYPNRGWF